jgi:hypothetical protein
MKIKYFDPARGWAPGENRGLTPISQLFTLTSPLITTLFKQLIKLYYIIYDKTWLKDTVFLKI